MGLCFDLGPVLEGDGDPGVLGDGHIIDHRQPVFIPEAYGMSIKDTTESSCVAELMRLYQEMTKGK